MEGYQCQKSTLCNKRSNKKECGINKKGILLCSEKHIREIKSYCHVHVLLLIAQGLKTSSNVLWKTADHHGTIECMIQFA